MRPLLPFPTPTALHSVARDTAIRADAALHAANVILIRLPVAEKHNFNKSKINTALRTVGRTMGTLRHGCVVCDYNWVELKLLLQVTEEQCCAVADYD